MPCSTPLSRRWSQGAAVLPGRSPWRTSNSADQTGLAFRVLLAENGAEVFELLKA